MLKKLVIVAAAVVVGLGIIRFTKVGRDCSGLAELWWHKSGDLVKNSIAPETRIEQLEMEIGKISRDVRAAVNKRADLKADYVMLKDDVDALKAKQEQRKKDLLVLADLLEQGSNQVVFQGYTYVAKTAQQKLDSLKTAFETGEQSLKAKTSLLVAREQRLVLAEQHILKIQQKQTELANLVDQMKTQLANIRMKQLENNTADFDDSQVSKCIALQQDLKKMLVREEILAEEKAKFGLTPPGSFDGTVPTRDESSIADSVKAARAAVAGESTKALAVDGKPAGVK